MSLHEETASSHDSRERILEAAARLFVEQGYRGLSMREIAEAVGVSKPAIYHHFADKEELFLAILNRYVEQLSGAVRVAAQVPEGAPAALARIARTILEQPMEQRALLRLATQDMAHLSAEARQRFGETYYATFLGSIRAVVEAGVAAGELRPVDSSVATWAMLGMLYPYSHASAPPPTQEIIEQVLALYLHGIVA